MQQAWWRSNDKVSIPIRLPPCSFRIFMSTTMAGCRWPRGTAEPLIAALEVMFPGSSTVRRRFDVKVIELQAGTGRTEIGHALVRAVEVDHGMPLTLVGLSV